MKKLLSFFILQLVVITIGNAQQVSLLGRVSIHNSSYRTGQIEYVPDTYLSAAFATPAKSDEAGQFELVFQGLPEGELVEISAEKDQLEVVNEYELNKVVLGRINPLKIFLAPKGELAKAQTELYEVSLAAITARHDKLITELRRDDERSRELITELEQQLNREIAHRYEAEDILDEQLKVIKERLPESTKQLALVNLDFASEQYRKAYEFYRQGKVLKAIATLDEGQLEASADRITGELANIISDRAAYAEALALEEEKIDQVVQAYELKAKAYNLVFEYSEATRVMQKVVNLLREVKEQPNAALTKAYEQLAQFSYDNGKYSESISAYNHCLDGLRKLNPENISEITDVYNALARAHLLQGDYQLAIKWQEEALALIERKEPIDSFLRAGIQVNMGVNYRYLGEYDKSIALQNNGLSFLERNLNNGNNVVELPAAYNNLALTYIDNLQPEKALEFQIKANYLAPKVYPENHPQLAAMDNNLALAYLALDSCETALVFAEKAIDRLSNSSLNKHPSLGIYYDNLAGIYSCLNETTLAIEANTKGMNILSYHFGEKSPSVLTSVGILAEIYDNSGAYDLAYSTLKGLLTDRLKVFTATHPVTLGVLKRLSIASSNLARTHQKENQVDLAIEKEEEAIQYLKQFMGYHESPYRTDSVYLSSEKLYLSNLYHKNDNLTAAIQNAKACYEERIVLYDALDPAIAEVCFFLASLYLENDQYDEFVFYQETTYSIWSQIRPASDYSLTAVKNNLFLVYTTRGISAENNADFSNATESYQRALKFIFSEEDNPEYKTQMIAGHDEAELTFKVGICSYQAKDYPTALSYFNKSYREEYLPELSYLYLTGLCYAQLERFEEAKQQFLNIEAIIPENGITYRNWALYYMFAGEEEKALNNLEKAYELGYYDAEWIEAENTFDTIREDERYKVIITKMRERN